MNNWMEFTARTGLSTLDLAPPPMTPSIEYAVKHAATAAQLWLDQAKTISLQEPAVATKANKKTRLKIPKIAALK